MALALKKYFCGSILICLLFSLAAGLITQAQQPAADKPWSAKVKVVGEPAEPHLAANSSRQFGVDGGAGLHLVWGDTRAEATYVYYKNSLDGGTNWSNELRLSTNTVG